MKNRIREYRKQKGISQETLSKELKVSRQTINAIENNKYDPTLTLAFKLARLFDTTVDELFSQPFIYHKKRVRIRTLFLCSSTIKFCLNNERL